MHLIRKRMNVSRIFPFAVGIFAATQLAAQSPSPTLIKAGRVLDPRSGKVLSAAAVLDRRAAIETGPVPLHPAAPHTTTMATRAIAPTPALFCLTAAITAELEGGGVRAGAIL